ncbi:MAG: hypothetical protein ACOYB3_01030 [Azonexus sp.]
MPKITPEQITAELEPVAVEAVLADKKVKLLAKVNHQDNFALYYAKVAQDAMMEAIIVVIEGPKGARRDAYTDWLNHACSTPARNPRLDCLDALARTNAAKAYAQLHPERCKS